MDAVELNTTNQVPRASGRVVGVRKAHETLAVLDDLTRAAATLDPRKRYLVRVTKASMLDMISELEALRALITAVKLPSCEKCGDHLGIWACEESVDYKFVCHGCYESFGDDEDNDYEQSSYTKLDWADQAEQIEELQLLWGSTKFTPDVRQVSFEFRNCSCLAHCHR